MIFMAYPKVNPDILLPVPTRTIGGTFPLCRRDRGGELDGCRQPGADVRAAGRLVRILARGLAAAVLRSDHEPVVVHPAGETTPATQGGR
jgi:hypothetical protein